MAIRAPSGRAAAKWEEDPSMTRSDYTDTLQIKHVEIGRKKDPYTILGGFNYWFTGTI